jgi:hypothetical protein
MGLLTGVLGQGPVLQGLGDVLQDRIGVLAEVVGHPEDDSTAK